MANKPRVYVDACCFIDVVKVQVGATLSATASNDAWFLKQLLQDHRDGRLIVHTSLLTIAECVAVEPGQINVPPVVQDHFRRLLTSGQYVHLLSPTPNTAVQVQRLRWEHNVVLSGADALHIASALERGCSEFITNDDRVKNSGKLKVAAPIIGGLGMRIIAASATHELSKESRQLPIDPAATSAASRTVQ